MKFFEGCRPEFYFHGGRLTKDQKSGKQFWKLNLVVTLKPQVVMACDEIIKSNYVAIETRANRIEEIKLSDIILDQVIEFFSLDDHKAPVLRCGPCDLTELRLTREDDLTELWLKADIENSDEVHQFVRDYVFQRLWVEFAPRQMGLSSGTLDALSGLTAPLRTEGIDSMTISTSDQSVTLTKEDADRIHDRLKKTRPN